jgi:hypothetical protein
MHKWAMAYDHISATIQPLTFRHYATTDVKQEARVLGGRCRPCRKMGPGAIEEGMVLVAVVLDHGGGGV